MDRINITCRGPTYLCTLYRPPSGNYQVFEALLESKVLDLYQECIPDTVILGDVNIDVGDKKSTTAKNYLKFLKTMGLDQLISEPTCVTSHSASIIDHIITNRHELYVNGGVLSLGISDHHLVFTNRKKAKISHSFSYIPCRCYTKLIDADFQRDVENIDWSPVLDCNDLDTAVNIFQELFMSVVDIHAPFIDLKMRDHAPAWIDGDMLAHINEREFWSRKHDKNPTEYHLEQKLLSKQRTIHLRHSLQSNHFDDSLEKCGKDSKKKWKLIKDYWPFLKKSTRITKIAECTDNIGKATKINEFFATIGDNLAQKIP